ncbi:amidase domain-containing protein [Alkalihalobacillus pseudalcaliphilus]|uniref:amidase domain-containing protein n=1 Tax=Alkalihalobacillus pseudalcaliphilus TaxID=79884 RepID=UPI00064E0999|nr:amidase domain-containing protein [Alkalihalobacillus pseudalcaliphilus]KMK75633.1 hypothetical protein AB990_10130 [Alkalihalobacillus pseudalcaliphilus]
MYEKQLKDYIERRNAGIIHEEFNVLTQEEGELEERKHLLNRKRGVELIKSNVKGRMVSKTKIERQVHIMYMLHYELLQKQREKLYLEERLECRVAVFECGKMINDHEYVPAVHEETKEEEVLNDAVAFHVEDMEMKHQSIKRSQPFLFSHHLSPEPHFRTLDPQNQRGYRLPRETGSRYNRLEAVRYAELWWNDYNPMYRKFTDNCTNFISQCMHAGGAYFWGQSNRSKGWWYSPNTWSFSWSVAHSFRWYLSGSTKGLRGIEKSEARELIPGDVICYDFDGDGRWQHNTIVVAKDFNGEPLVNAQTTNSRMRYWSYEDSSAYTPEIQYKFFRIVVD